MVTSDKERSDLLSLFAGTQYQYFSYDFLPPGGTQTEYTNAIVDTLLARPRGAECKPEDDPRLVNTELASAMAAAAAGADL